MNETETLSRKETEMILRPIAPTETGALAGFEAVCPLCGMALRNTVRSNLELDAEAHSAWHAKNESDRDEVAGLDGAFAKLHEDPFEDEFLRRPDGSIYGRRTR